MFIRVEARLGRCTRPKEVGIDGLQVTGRVQNRNGQKAHENNVCICKAVSLENAKESKLSGRLQPYSMASTIHTVQRHKVYRRPPHVGRAQSEYTAGVSVTKASRRHG